MRFRDMRVALCGRRGLKKVGLNSKHSKWTTTVVTHGRAAAAAAAAAAVVVRACVCAPEATHGPGANARRRRRTSIRFDDVND